MIPVKMVIFRDVDGDPAMCKAKDLHVFLEAGDTFTIEKIFFAIKHSEAGRIFNDHEGFGEYKPMMPDVYLSNGEEVK